MSKRGGGVAGAGKAAGAADITCLLFTQAGFAAVNQKLTQT